MFSVQKVENNIRSLYRYGMDAAGYSKASVESMLDTLNFYELAQAAQHNSTTPHASVLNSAMFSHRGRELFGQRAALLYADSDIPDNPVTVFYSDCVIPDKAVIIVHSDCVMPDEAVIAAVNALRDSFLYRVSASHAYELWMLEYGSLVTASRVKLSFDCPFLGRMEMIYRETGRYPWESDMRFTLEELTESLLALCEPVKRGEYPLYEL